MTSRRPLRDRLPAFRRQATLPSLYDRYPRADRAPRRPRGLQVVLLDRIVGTTRNPSQNTVDFRPLPSLRGRNWRGRWQRIRRAVDQLAELPAVDLVRVGDEYYVVDGHNRVAAALLAGAVAIDADVTELAIPGVESTDASDEPHQDAASLLLGADELRQAVAGRQSRTAEHRPEVDEMRREQLTLGSEVATDSAAESDGPAEPDPE